MQMQYIVPTVLLQLDNPQHVQLPPNSAIHLDVPEVFLNISAVFFAAHISDRFSSSNVSQLSLVLSNNSHPASLGSDIGVICRLSDNQTSSKAILTNLDALRTVDVFLLVHGLSRGQPLPGGCANLSENTSVAFPNIQQEALLSEGDIFGYRKLNLEPAGRVQQRGEETLEEAFCSNETLLKEEVTYEMIGRFVNPEAKDEIFRGFAGNFAHFRTVCKRKFGESVDFLIPEYRTKAHLLLTVLVRNTSSKLATAYVPLLLHFSNTSDSSPLELKFYTAFCSFLALAACCLLFFGHKHFRFGVFAVGSAVGCFIAGFILLCIIKTPLSTGYVLFFGLGLFSAVTGGLLLMLIWQETGSPLLVVLSSTLVSGYILASVFSYFIFDSWSYLREHDISPIVYFLVIQLATVGLLIYWLKFAHIFSLSILGATIFTVALCEAFLRDATVQFVIFRSFQRFFDPHFARVACIFVPFSTTDMVVSLLWAVEVLVGIFAQLRLSRKDGPYSFPPPPDSVVKRVFDGFSPRDGVRPPYDEIPILN